MNTGVKILSDGIAVFKCNKCNQLVRDDTHFFSEKPSQTFKVRCAACGFSNRAIVENRQTARKNVNFSGIYKLPSNDEEVKSGSMTVRDISWQGFKLRVSSFEPCIIEHDLQRHRYDKEKQSLKSMFLQNYLSVGELITIEFFLDDPKMSFVARQVYIRWIKDNHIGVELRFPEAFEPDIRFYLIGMNNNYN